MSSLTDGGGDSLFLLSLDITVAFDMNGYAREEDDLRSST